MLQVNPEIGHIAVVLSPLISLMEDQTQQLTTKYNINSIHITSTTDKRVISGIYIYVIYLINNCFPYGY